MLLQNAAEVVPMVLKQRTKLFLEERGVRVSNDVFFENPDSINTLVFLPAEGIIHPTQKSEHHFTKQQSDIQII